MTVLCCRAQELSYDNTPAPHVINDYTPDDTPAFLRNLITDVYDEEQVGDEESTDGDVADDNFQRLVDDVTEQLRDIAAKHLNLNTLSVQELSEVPLLSEQQAEAILHYRALYGDLRTMTELSLIPALDEARRRLLRYLFVLAPSPRREYVSQIAAETDSLRREGRAVYGQSPSPRHSLNLTIGIPTYSRKGFDTPFDKGGYHGYNVMHTLRYRFQHHDITAAFTAAQNYGEPFFSGTNAKGYDFYTGFVRIKNKGIIEDLVLGHYQLSVGMGLIMNKRMRSTRTMLLTSMPDVRMTISGHASRSSSNYLQGIATKLRLPYNMHAVLFASYNSLDASVTPTSVTSILTTGYHRTDTEIERRNTVRETVLGGALYWSKAPYYLVLTLLNTHYNLPLLPTKTQFYRYFYPEGSDFFNASLSYSYTSSRLRFAGEVAVSPQGQKARSKEQESEDTKGSDGASLATSNSVRWRLSESFSLFALHRFLSYRFESLHGKTMSVNSAVRNENGLYLGATYIPLPHLTLSAYIDYAHHPWAVYGISYPYGVSGGVLSTTAGTKDTKRVPPVTSRTWEHQLQAEYNRTLSFADLNMQLRYRYRDNALTDNPYYGTVAMVMPFAEDILKGQHTLRMKARLKSRTWWTMAQMHFTSCSNGSNGGNGDGSSTSNGFLSALSGGVGQTLSVSASLTYFHTDDYASRLYVQEPSLAYGTGTAMLFDHGLRSTVTTTYKPMGNKLSFAAQVSLDHYFNRSTISSGMQTISGSNKCDILLQVSLSL